MSSFHLTSSFCLLILIVTISFKPASSSSRKLAALIEQQPLVLHYHNGILLKGNYTVNLIWYGKFSPLQHSVIVDFIKSLNSEIKPSPSLSSWWSTTEKYSGGATKVILRQQIVDDSCSIGKTLKSTDLISLAVKGSHRNSINIVLTAKDVVVEGFCMSRCGTHGSAKILRDRFAYIWVGNSETQCPGQCAWPFHQPIYGPQTPPLVAPNGDVGVDGLVINLATLLAGTVTNPFENGYFQGPANAPMEAVSACTGIFGKGAYPGYPGAVLIDKVTGSSYNAQGLNGRKFLIPAMWNPQTSSCSTLV